MTYKVLSMVIMTLAAIYYWEMVSKWKVLEQGELSLLFYYQQGQGWTQRKGAPPSWRTEANLSQLEARGAMETNVTA